MMSFRQALTVSVTALCGCVLLVVACNVPLGGEQTIPELPSGRAIGYCAGDGSGCTPDAGGCQDGTTCLRYAFCDDGEVCWPDLPVIRRVGSDGLPHDSKANRYYTERRRRSRRR